jgi:predicted dehydrogenase
MTIPQPTDLLGLALVGLGRANQARQRDAGTIPGVAVLATVSRREGVGSHTLAQVLANPAIHAVCIATENATHADLAEQCLQAGKHVLVDFPLAGSLSQAQGLHALASEQGLVLHTESIGLLTGEHAAFKRLQQERPLASVELEFAADLNGWVLDEARLGHLGQLGIGRLQALDDLFGPLTLLHATGAFYPQQEVAPGQWTGPGYRVDAMLQGPLTRVHWAEVRRPGLARVRQWTGTHVGGEALVVPVAQESRGLFGRDLAVFVGRIRGTAQAYCGEAAVERVIGLAEGIGVGVVVG